MKIDPMKIQGAAIRDPRGCLMDRMNNDDPTLTYEEVILYWMCRASSAADFINPDHDFACWKKGGHLDRIWLRLSASKTHPMEITHPWDEIFPMYKKELDEKTHRKAQQSEEANK